MIERGLAETLADEWVLLFSRNTNKPISNYSFKKRYDDIDRQYKLLPDHEKAIFNRIIHRGIKDVITTLTGEPNGGKAEIRIAKSRIG